MHRQQDLFQLLDQDRSQIFSDGDEMAWQASRFSQDRYVRLFLGVKCGIIVVAERSGRHLFRENQVNEFVLRIDKNVTDFSGRNIAVDLRFL